MTTDTSLEGWGAHLKDLEISSKWSAQDAKMPISLLNYIAVVLQCFLLRTKNVVVLVCTDNSTSVYYLNNCHEVHEHLRTSWLILDLVQLWGAFGGPLKRPLEHFSLCDITLARSFVLGFVCAGKLPSHHGSLCCYLNKVTSSAQRCWKDWKWILQVEHVPGMRTSGRTLSAEHQESATSGN